MRKRATAVLALAGALTIGAVPAAAQAGPGRMEPAGPGIEALLRQRDRLGLTDEQVQALRELRTELQAEMEPLREEMRAEALESRQEARARREARRERMEGFRDRLRAVREQHRTRIEGVLTDDD